MSYRRGFRAVVVAAASAFAATAASLATAPLAVTSAGAAPPPAATAVASSEQSFALDLLHRLGASEPNLVLSPSSLGTLLAMLEPGAAGTTELGIARALSSSSLSPAGQAQGWAALGTWLRNRAARDHTVLDTANQAWFQKTLSVLPSYLATLSQDFHTGVQHLAASPAASASAIDAWVAAHTGGHITHLLSAAELVNAVAVLVDAVYMKAAWDTPFDASLTGAAPFYTAPGHHVTVQMMESQQDWNAALSTSPGLDAIALPYRGDDLSALVLMPPLGRLGAFEQDLSAAELSQIVAQLSEQRVSLYMPRFSVSSDLSLEQVLSEMGMAQAFSNSADFSNLSAQPVKLSFVVQDAQMKVNENGTEASAASAAGIEPTAVAPMPHVTIDIDHPFLFLIRDNATGLVLFEAQVGDPA
ncbi:MAG TPA: serpin family protein [Acidimicrobiales bacterium]|nr:serpin family protein [Acidimicrobiales bacterium]